MRHLHGRVRLGCASLLVRGLRATWQQTVHHISRVHLGKLQVYMDEGWIDTFRRQHEGVHGYTYYSYRFNMCAFDSRLQGACGWMGCNMFVRCHPKGTGLTRGPFGFALQLAPATDMRTHAQGQPALHNTVTSKRHHGLHGTLRCRRAKKKGWRLDYFLASDGLADRLHDSFILPDFIGSDHCPIGLVLKDAP